MIDENSGLSGFFDPGNPNEYSWAAQIGATIYEAARSRKPDFSDQCVLFSTVGTVWYDAEPVPPGGIFYYLNRPISPNIGSWGQDSSGLGRIVNCPSRLHDGRASVDVRLPRAYSAGSGNW